MRALFIPGTSPVHRCPAELKLSALAILAVIVAAGDGRAVAALALVVLAAWSTARIGMGPLAAVFRPLAVILAILLLAQAYLRGWETGILVVARLAVLIAAAAMVTATTPVSAMIAALEAAFAPLRRFGIEPGRVSLPIVLGIRFLPALARIGGEVREAQRARGLERAPLAVVVPILIRALREADDVAEALVARGWPQ
jgi:biotin transport system permease protein